MGEQVQYLLVHFKVGEAQVDDILHEGKEEHAGGEAVGFRQMSEQPEANLVGEDGEMLILEDLAGLDDFFLEGDVLLVDIAGYLP